MKLSIEQLKSVTHGAVRLEELANGVRFWRVTEAQIQHFLDRGDEHQAINAAPSAGVRLAFVTDSRTLTFSADLLPDLTGDGLGFDVYENGAMIAHFGRAGEAVRDCFVPLAEGETLVEIYFPWSKGVVLNALCLDDGASLKPHRRSRTLLAFGDSITHGCNAVYPSLTYANRLATMLDADLENRGVGGDKFSHVTVELEPVEKADIVTVAYGTNDWSHLPLERLDRECPATLAVLAKKYPYARIFVITPLWRTDADTLNPVSGVPLTTIAEHIREAARPFANMTVIDAYSFVPHLKEFFADHVHPNDMGFACYAERLFAEISKHLN